MERGTARDLRTAGAWLLRDTTEPRYPPQHEPRVTTSRSRWIRPRRHPQLRRGVAREHDRRTPGRGCDRSEDRVGHRLVEQRVDLLAPERRGRPVPRRRADRRRSLAGVAGRVRRPGRRRTGRCRVLYVHLEGGDRRSRSFRSGVRSWLLRGGRLVPPCSLARVAQRPRAVGLRVPHRFGLDPACWPPCPG